MPLLQLTNGNCIDMLIVKHSGMLTYVLKLVDIEYIYVNITS